MDFVATRLPEVILIKPQVLSDERGFFLETWQEKRFSAAGIHAQFVQDNHSHSRRHALRGLHFQIQQPQGKLVRVVTGAVFDVAVDMRRSSARFGQWIGVELNSNNHHMMWVPPGFAHGYLTLSASADLLYKCTDYYAPQFERSVRRNDPRLGIYWPLPTSTEPILSSKDAVAPLLANAESYS